MNLSPYNQARCDQTQCKIGGTCNLIALAFTILMITGLAAS
ncbi:hypothetical protein [Endozoicomonas sp. OPT23]|nr:hypothetical protein [Endozoicomonas sp. OPT23]